MPLANSYPSLGRVRALSRLLDSAVKIPGTGIRFGADSLIGLVPGLGDAFDVAWKSNQKNVALLENHLAKPATARRTSGLLLTAVVIAAIALLVLMGVGILGLIRVLFR